ncbi:MAG TPA: HEAT repeat domain-containing protein [Candidatus Elarobacter sp.]|nr:HEAT repeat domain-containing protein [Candidatus Elarobacter sp.]
MLAVELPHGEFLVFGIFFFIVGTGLIAIARFLPQSREPIVTAVSPVETMALGEPDATWEPQTPPVPELVAHAITWPALVDPAAGALDDSERRRVIDGLGIVGDPWCADILVKAFEEEDGELRVAALESLGHCTADLVAPVLQRAYASHVVAERYAAVDGASRRGDVKLLERALHDADTTVALAAAYGLQRANRKDVIENNLVARIDDGANEIRSVLELLG